MTEEPPSISGATDLADPSALAGCIVVDVNIPEKRWLDHIPWLAAMAGEAARDACLAGGNSVVSGDAITEISLTFADDDFVRQLNSEHRSIERPTNVLSFPSIMSEDAPAERTKALPGGESHEAAPAPELLLGDVVLGFETVMKEAGDQGKRPADHVAHLVTHGVLHLLGFDHQQDDEATCMERLETRIMENLGIGDPYGEPINGGDPPAYGDDQ
jgi:probable rRNA maturation factor